MNQHCLRGQFKFISDLFLLQVSIIYQTGSVMKSPLVPKSNNFNQIHEELALRIQSIRRKNDQYQRLSGEDIDPGMAQEILEEKHIMDKEVNDTRKIIEQMEKIVKDPQHRNKLKQTKKQYQKQSSRFKLISEALMEKSVIRAQMRDSLNRRKSLPGRNRLSREQTYRQVVPNRDSGGLAQEQLDVDLDLEQKILADKRQQLGQTEQQMQRIYALMNDMSNEVNQQGNHIDIIGEEVLKAQNNVEGANEELDEARVLQKKGNKKCYILVGIVLLVLLIGMGAYFIISNKVK